MYYELIKKYYENGYGFPKKYYTAADVDRFAEKGIITAAEAEEIKAMR